MVIFSVYVVNKAGGLIYELGNYVPQAKAEKTFSYPLDLLLKEVPEYLGNSANHSVSIRFSRPCLTPSKKLMLASIFHSLFAIGSQLSPKLGSSGIEMPKTDTFKLHCFQTQTDIKFIVLADPQQGGIDSVLRKIYKIYSDFALKNPFYSLDMPIRCKLFDQNLKLALEVAEKAGTFGPGP